jgi:hypothetical protein
MRDYTILQRHFERFFPKSKPLTDDEAKYIAKGLSKKAWDYIVWETMSP